VHHSRNILALLSLAVCLAGCGLSQQSRSGDSDRSVISAQQADKEATIRQTSYEQKTVAKPEPQPEAKKEPEPKQRIDLPTAIALCTLQNFRLQADATRIGQAEANLLSASLIPNATLFTDGQFIPLQHTDINNQLGPPQMDALVTIPIDWLVFGKRVAATQAERLGVTVVRAGHDDLVRRTTAETVDRFYEVLQAEEFLKLAEKSYEEMKELQEQVGKLVAAGKAGEIETKRVRLEALEAMLNVHGRELDLASAKAKFRPLIGRSATDPDFDCVGKLEVKAVVPPPNLAEALTLAEAHRPDLHAARMAIAHAEAATSLERRRAKPQVAVQPGWSYQFQRPINGFPNGSMLDIGLSVTLPITDRNQGNIRRAELQARERAFTYEADRADILAEVEIVIAAYDDAVEDVTENNDPATLRDALELHAKIEAEFRAGNRKLVEVLDAHRAYRDRVARVVEFEATYWRMLNRLNAAVGLSAYDHERSMKRPVKYDEKKP